MLTGTLAFSLIAAALVAVSGTSAANAITSDRKDVLDIPQGPDATVVVRNYNNSLRVEIHAVTEAGRRFQLGVVNQASERTFELPDRLADGSTQFRLKVYSFVPPDPRSAVRDYREGVKTRPLFMTAGEKIVLIVANPLARSFIDSQ
jgi:hypothetical protein